MTKICVKCKQEKDVSLFWKNKNKPDGYGQYCIECNKKLNREMYLKHKEKRLAEAQVYRAENKEHYREYFKKYKREHRDEIREKYKPHVREYQRRKRAEDPNTRIKNAMSCRIRNHVNKSGERWIDIVGYTVNDLREHLEKQFTKGMTWDNYGEWHIDHRVPIASFDLTKEENIKECWSLGNLQPLWAEENRRKSDKRIYLL